MSQALKLKVPTRFANAIAARTQPWLLTTKAVKAPTAIELTDADTKQHFATVKVTEALAVSIGIGHITITPAGGDEQPYDIGNRDVFAKAAGFNDFDDMKDFITDGGKKELPQAMTLVKWSFADVTAHDVSESDKKESAATTKKAEQKGKAAPADTTPPAADTTKAEGEGTGEGNGAGDDEDGLDNEELDLAIADAESRLAAATDPLEKDSITAELDALKAQKQDGDDNA